MSEMDRGIKTAANTKGSREKEKKRQSGFGYVIVFLHKTRIDKVLS